MTEPTITCPNCKTKIKLTESLAASLIAATCKQSKQQLAQKDSDCHARTGGRDASFSYKSELKYANHIYLK